MSFAYNTSATVQKSWAEQSWAPANGKTERQTILIIDKQQPLNYTGQSGARNNQRQRQPTINSKHSTTNNIQLPPTDTTDNQHQHPTTDRGRGKKYKKILQTRLEAKTTTLYFFHRKCDIDGYKKELYKVKPARTLPSTNQQTKTDNVNR